jgi:tRNA modification GTPase
VVAGRPNVGKSSLFNLLAGADRAIVTPVAGTTRDLVSERVDIEGLAVTLVDTAGWRETQDVVEREGVARSKQARDVADLLLVMLDRSEPIRGEDEELLAQTTGRPRIVVVNKSDLPASALPSRLKPARTNGAADVGAGFSRLERVEVSAKTGAGVEALRRAIVRELTGRESLRDAAAISNTRHIALLEQARANLVAASESALAAAPEEFILTDLQAARARLDEVVGARTSDDLLQHIFERFCIGK